MVLPLCTTRLVKAALEHADEHKRDHYADRRIPSSDSSAAVVCGTDAVSTD